MIVCMRKMSLVPSPLKYLHLDWGKGRGIMCQRREQIYSLYHQEHFSGGSCFGIWRSLSTRPCCIWSSKRRRYQISLLGWVGMGPHVLRRGGIMVSDEDPDHPDTLLSSLQEWLVVWFLPAASRWGSREYSSTGNEATVRKKMIQWIRASLIYN